MKKDNLIDWFSMLDKIVAYDIQENIYEGLFFEYNLTVGNKMLHAKVTLRYKHKDIFSYFNIRPLDYDKDLLKSETSLRAINAFIVYNAKEMIKNNQQ